MTGQRSRAQRRRASRSATTNTTTNTTIGSSTQIHSGMVRLLSRAGCCRAGWCHTSQVVVAGAERPPRACGAAGRGPRPPPAAPPVPTVCLLDGLPCRSAPASTPLRRTRRHPSRLRRRPDRWPTSSPPGVDTSGSGMDRRHRSPGAGEEHRPTSRQKEVAMQALLNAWVMACRYGDLATARYLEREVARRVAQRQETRRS